MSTTETDAREIAWKIADSWLYNHDAGQAELVEAVAAALAAAARPSRSAAAACSRMTRSGWSISPSPAKGSPGPERAPAGGGFVIRSTHIAERLVGAVVREYLACRALGQRVRP